MTTETTELQVFHIPAENMPGLFTKIEKLSKKSVKLIGKPIALDVLREVRKPHMVQSQPGNPGPRDAQGYVQKLDDDGNLCWDVWYDVTIDAETPKINGWTFVATIDHSAVSGNIIRSAPNANCDIPEMYRSVKPICDHCGKIRSRRDTFLLRCDATGEFKQIGRQCIRDFIGYDVTQAVALAELSGSSLPSSSDRDYDGGMMMDRRYIFVRTYLAHVAAMIRKIGWISRKDAQIREIAPTSSDAHYNMFPPPQGRKDILIPLIDKDFETADAALEYGLTLASNPRGEYEYNLSVICQESMIEGRSMGLLASLIPAFFRHSEREFAKLQKRAALKLGESGFVGTVGDKIGTGKAHTIAPFEAVLYGFNSFDGRFGPTYLYRFRGDDGNVFVWYASEGPAETLGLGGLDASRRVRVQIAGGTIKKHTEYQDVKQTVLTRAKVVVIKVEDTEAA